MGTEHWTLIIWLIVGGVFLRGGEQLHILNTTPVARRVEFNLDDFGGNPAFDCQGALSNAIAAASAVTNGTVLIPRDYPLSILVMSASNVRFKGPGRLHPTGYVTNWITITGTNIWWDNLELDGTLLARTLVKAAPPTSGDWHFKTMRFKNGYANDTNDAPKTASVNGFFFSNGFSGLTVDDCLFYNFDYQGTFNQNGVQRFTAGIWGGQFQGTSSADHLWDIQIRNSRFINIGKNKEGCDGIRLQGYDISLPSGIFIEKNYFNGCGWRGFKALIGGGIASGNWILSQEPGPVVTRAMYSAIGIYGSNWSVSDNWFIGGACYRAFDAESSVLGRVENVSFKGNHVIFPAPNGTYDARTDSDAINLENVRGGTVANNEIRYARTGVNVGGWCEGIAIGSNSILDAGLLGVIFRQETSAGTWFGQYPNNCTVTATAADGYSAYAVQADPGCTNITVVGTQGTSGFGGFNRSAGVTGESAANSGSILPLKASTSSTNYFLRIDAAQAGIGSVKFVGPFENTFLSYDDTGSSGVNQLNLGRTSGNTVLLGTAFFGSSRKFVNGNGSPEGVVTANQGSIYTRNDGGAGTTLYVKESGSGNTGWIAK